MTIWKREKVNRATCGHSSPAPLFVYILLLTSTPPHHPIMRRGENGTPVVMARLLFNQCLHGDAASQPFICLHLHLFPQVGLLLSSISGFVSEDSHFLSGLHSLLLSSVVPIWLISPLVPITVAKAWSLSSGGRCFQPGTEIGVIRAAICCLSH